VHMPWLKRKGNNLARVISSVDVVLELGQGFFGLRFDRISY